MSRLATLFGAALTMAACTLARSEDFQDVAAERASLAAGLKSYSKPGAAERSLGVDTTAWTLLEDTRYQGSSSRPAYRMQIAVVPGQSVNGMDGDLELRFFNDRLMETYFCPKNYAKFIERLSERYPDIASGQALHIETHVELRVGPSASHRQCVVWGDLRLQQQLERWIKVYS